MSGSIQQTSTSQELRMVLAGCIVGSVMGSIIGATLGAIVGSCIGWHNEINHLVVSDEDLSGMLGLFSGMAGGWLGCVGGGIGGAVGKISAQSWLAAVSGVASALVVAVLSGIVHLSLEQNTFLLARSIWLVSGLTGAGSAAVCSMSLGRINRWNSHFG
jgi:hypothetical protein